MGMDSDRAMFGRCVDALLGQTFDALLPEGEVAIVRVSSIDQDRQTVVLFVVRSQPYTAVRRRVYDLQAFGRLIREEWQESNHP